MPRKRKYDLDIEATEIQFLFDKYKSDLNVFGWRDPSSIWGTLLLELGVPNKESNRRGVYDVYKSKKSLEVSDGDDSRELTNPLIERDATVDTVSQSYQEKNIENSSVTEKELVLDRSTLDSSLKYKAELWDSSPEISQFGIDSQFGELKNRSDIVSLSDFALAVKSQETSSLNLSFTSGSMRDLEDGNLFSGSITIAGGIPEDLNDTGGSKGEAINNTKTTFTPCKSELKSTPRTTSKLESVPSELPTIDYDAVTSSVGIVHHSSEEEKRKCDGYSIKESEKMEDNLSFNMSKKNSKESNEMSSPLHISGCSDESVKLSSSYASQTSAGGDMSENTQDGSSDQKGRKGSV